jgi:hypothetical protein
MRQGPPSGGPCPQAVRVGMPWKAAASSGPNSVLTQADVQVARSAVRKRAAYWPRLRGPSRVNSQCSTRKHGRPVTHSVTRGAGAP